MRLIKPSVEYIKQEPGLEGLLKHIELCGRVCYKSESAITEDSSEKFVNNLIKSGHTSVLEHGSVQLLYTAKESNTNLNWYQDYGSNPYSRGFIGYGKTPDGNFGPIARVYTNYRVLLNLERMDDIKFMTDVIPESSYQRFTFRFTCDRGISHELVRHRVFSFTQESTRFCNYSKNKFNNEITFITPPWVDALEGDYGSRVYPKLVRDPNTDSTSQIFIDNCRFSEECYFRLLEAGWLPQQARAVLPNALKTELIMTGFACDWAQLLKLRLAPAAHPQMRELMKLLVEEMEKNHLLDGAISIPNY
jgi:thymidylate synthase (FAD)|nr:MAG TPA: Thymidylate synthase complementing protein [Crassvirales sp.]